MALEGRAIRSVVRRQSTGAVTAQRQQIVRPRAAQAGVGAEEVLPAPVEVPVDDPLEEEVSDFFEPASALLPEPFEAGALESPAESPDFWLRLSVR
jgi:hypothetical protein